MRILAILAAWLALAVSPALALTPAQKAAASVNPCAGIQVQLSFAGSSPSCFKNSRISTPTAAPGWSFSRASTGYGQTSAGLLVNFGSGVPRITDQGILIEGAATNVALWNRDLTNAAWTKTNATPLLNLTGADGTANAASTLTATAGNATCLQAVTLGSSQRQQSAFVKRVTGSGVVNMTTDGGTTWTAITLTANWAQVSIPAQTLANPNLGFRITTNGDAIGVDFVQNETGAFATSPILTTTAAATRAAELPVLTRASAPFVGTLLGSVSVTPLSTAQMFAFLSDGTANNFAAVILGSGRAVNAQVEAASSLIYNQASGTFSGPSSLKAAISYDSTTYRAAVNGMLLTPGAAGQVSGLTKLNLGTNGLGGSYLNGYLRSVTLYSGFPSLPGITL